MIWQLSFLSGVLDSARVLPHHNRYMGSTRSKRDGSKTAELLAIEKGLRERAEIKEEEERRERIAACAQVSQICSISRSPHAVARLSPNIDITATRR